MPRGGTRSGSSSLPLYCSMMDSRIPSLKISPLNPAPRRFGIVPAFSKPIWRRYSIRLVISAIVLLDDGLEDTLPEDLAIESRPAPVRDRASVLKADLEEVLDPARHLCHCIAR